MTEAATTIIPGIILKGLSDKLYDKRKIAALELEKLVREWIFQRPTDFNESVTHSIKLLTDEFIHTNLPNLRNGGLIGLAAVAIALGPELISEHIDNLILPVLACFQDMDSRGRYYACESLFNISKVARPNVLRHFPAIFDILSKLSADTDSSVKNGAELLDRLLKGIITEQKSDHVANYPLFTMETFIVLLKERIHTLNPYTRSFLVSWLSVLNSVPGIELLSHLPAFLPGLFHFLTDSSDHVRLATNQLLAELLRGISTTVQLQKKLGMDPSSPLKEKIPTTGEAATTTKANTIATHVEPETLLKEGEAGHWQPHLNVCLDFPKLFQLLLPFLESVQRDIQVTCLQWINEFIVLSKNIMLPFTAHILKFILPSIASNDTVIKSTATTTHSLLFSLLSKTETLDEGYLDKVMEILFSMVQHPFEDTRLASLEWLLMLHPKSPTWIREHPPFLSQVFKVLSDASMEVLKKGLLLLIQIASVSTESQFEHLIAELLVLFAKDRKFLEARGPLIVRQLCLALSPDRVFQTFALVLEKDVEMDFAATMVTNLNIILITSPELASIRRQLRQFDAVRSTSELFEAGQNLFVSLYPSWCHSPMAVYSLCLLAEAYEHAFELLLLFEDLEISLSFLVQMDKLVQLIESPVFSYLRLHLLEPERHPYLFKCLYGLLMLLPQSSAFATLRNRLNCITNLHNMIPSTIKSDVSSKNFRKTKTTLSKEMWTKFLEQFRAVQFRHERARKAMLMASRVGQQRRSKTSFLTTSSPSLSNSATSNQQNPDG